VDFTAPAFVGPDLKKDEKDVLENPLYKTEETEVDLDKHQIWNKTARDDAQLGAKRTA